MAWMAPFFSRAPVPSLAAVDCRMVWSVKKRPIGPIVCDTLGRFCPLYFWHVSFHFTFLAFAPPAPTESQEVNKCVCETHARTWGLLCVYYQHCEGSGWGSWAFCISIAPWLGIKKCGAFRKRFPQSHCRIRLIAEHSSDICGRCWVWIFSHSPDDRLAEVRVDTQTQLDHFLHVCWKLFHR